MTALLTIARQEMFALRRERMPRLMLLIFATMVALSGFIGMLTKNTVSNVWLALSAQGFTSQPNPFADVSPLYFARNTIIYIVLIGTLMAIVAGVSSALRERRAQTTDLVLSRPLSTGAFVFGKLAGVGMWLGLILLSLWAIASLMLTLINGALLTPGDYLALAVMFLLALPLLLGYAALGLLFGFVSARETSALVGPISIWAFVTFVIPQLGTAAQPISLLNPTPAVSTSGGFFALAGPFTSALSVSERFKEGALVVLAQAGSATGLWSAVACLVCFALVSAASLMVVRRHTMRGIFSE